LVTATKFKSAEPKKKKSPKAQCPKFYDLLISFRVFDFFFFFFDKHENVIKECLAGFSFADDQEAGIFYKKVTNPEEPKKKKCN